MRRIIRLIGFGLLVLANTIVSAQQAPRRYAPQRQSFPLTAVRLLPGPFKQVKDQDATYLLSLDPNRYLYWPRTVAGLPTTVTHYGGWEDGGTNILGHYLTACALMYATTGDKRLLDRVNYIVDEMARCQQKLPEGGIYQSKGQRDAYEAMRRGVFKYRLVGPEFPVVNDNNPWYGTHKFMAGLRDAVWYTGSPKAKQVLTRYADWAYELVMPIADSTFQKTLNVEHGGMTEVFADIYTITGEKKYLDLARKFVHQRLYRPMLEGRDVLYPHHANAQIPKFIGYQRLYEVADDADAGKSAANFFDQVLKHHTMVIGGNSEYERFGPAGQITKRIGYSSSETCNTYNMLKLADQLYRQTGDARYMAYYERALYNHILASVEPQSGMFCYYVSTKPGFFKTFSTPTNSNWCCVGTGMENPGKYEGAIYAHNNNALYVNLYLPSRLDWPAKQVALRQETTFPESETVQFTVEKAGAGELALHLRNPDWTDGEAQLQLNGKPLATATNSPYLTVKRRWKQGDRLTLRLPMRLRVEDTPDNPNVSAILYGPIVLAGELGDLRKEGIEPYAPGDMWVTQKKPELNNVPVFVVDKQYPQSWIKPVDGQPLTFVATSSVATPGVSARSVTLVPFYRLYRQRYSLYWDMFTPAAWETREQYQTKYLQDAVTADDSVGERAHNLRGSATRRSNIYFRNYRTADSTGWFAYDLNANTEGPLYLVCRFWGGGWGPEPGGTVDIFVNDAKIATKNLGDKLHETVFYDEVYPVPTSLRTAGKKLSVRFEPRGKVQSGLFGCKITTAEGLSVPDLIREQ